VENPSSRLASLVSGVVAASVVTEAKVEFGLARTDRGPRLVVLAERGLAGLDAFEGERTPQGDSVLVVGPLSARNAAALRARLAWLRPSVVGLSTSGGFGDRLGCATPGHIRAVRATGSVIAPIFAQQSIREMTRTGRTPVDVVDDATWGVFGEGWRDGFGGDADHLKTTEDIDRCLEAGFTLFTIDPGEHVWSGADGASAREVREAVARLPWDTLQDSAAACEARYAGRSFDVGGHVIGFTEEALLRAAAKYGCAVAHVSRLYRHLVSAAKPGDFELEVSVDETDSPTSHAEHYYVASELMRLGVSWVSLAPRYVGRFEKGVDYIGDLDEFERDVTVHAQIARALGPYKLSLHSGSDKFAIYPIVARHTNGLVHLKTAGTSYLEALRAVAAADPDRFREIYGFCRDHYEADRASYHVSATLAKAPATESLAAANLTAVLDQFDARQVLHVTFGSVLTTLRPDGQRLFYDRVMGVLAARPDVYAGFLETHFRRHLEPFIATAVRARA
jgi:tagaturonate epimerase